MVVNGIAALAPPEDPPSIAELAEQTRRSAPPPAPAFAHESRIVDEDVATLMEGVPDGDLRCPFDSILPSALDSLANDDLPAPFDLVNGRPSGFGWRYASAREPLHVRAPLVAALAGLVLLFCIAVAAPRVRREPPATAAREAVHARMTPAEAASWATAPFTIDVPLETPAATRSTPATETRERPAETREPPAAHFDLEAAALALAEAKASLSDCVGGDDDPTMARATVTFAPAGRVAALAFDPPLETGPASACVMNHLRGIRIEPFSGPNVTVRTTVALPPVGPSP